MVSSLTGSDAFRQRPMVTLGLDLQQTRNLHRSTQEDGVKHLFPRVSFRAFGPRKLMKMGRAKMGGGRRGEIDAALEP